MSAKKVFGATLAVIFVEIVTALVEGGGKQRHWCRYSNCSMRSRLMVTADCSFYSMCVAGFVLGALAGFNR